MIKNDDEMKKIDRQNEFQVFMSKGIDLYPNTTDYNDNAKLSDEGFVSVLKMIDNIVVYESIYDLFLTARIQFLDAISFFEKYEIRGIGERFDFDIEVPHFGEVLSYTGKINGLYLHHMKTNLRYKHNNFVYFLECASREAFLNSKRRVSNNYIGEAGSQIESVLRNELFTEKEINSKNDTTMGNVCYYGKRKAPSESIRSIANLGGGDLSDKIFVYETAEGFNIDSLSAMIEKEPVDIDAFTLTEYDVRAIHNNVHHNYSNLGISETKKENINESLGKSRSGGLGGGVEYMIDVKNKDIQIDRAGLENKSDETSSTINYKTTNFPELFYSHNKRKAKEVANFMSSYNSSTITTPLNPSLRAGMVIYLNIKKMNFDSDIDGFFSSFNSGKYLILSLSNSISVANGPNGKTILNVVKVPEEDEITKERKVIFEEML